MEPREPVEELRPLGVVAFTTTRAAGSYSTATDESVGEVMARWYALRDELRALGARFATAKQVHGNTVVAHGAGWGGWLRADDADGHFTSDRGTAMAVTVADCVPVFLAHPEGACALLHSGWRGTVARITERGIAAFAARGLGSRDLAVHLGPAICGRCYEVSADVYTQLVGRAASRPTRVDLRELIAGQVAAAGVKKVSISPRCTRCDNDRFFSHRAGDEGRQLGVMVAPA